MVIQWKLVDLVDFLCGELNHNESAVRIDLSSAERQSEEREIHRHTHSNYEFVSLFRVTIRCSKNWY